MAGGQPQGYPLPLDHLWCSNSGSWLCVSGNQTHFTEACSIATGKLFVIQAYVQMCLKRAFLGVCSTPYWY